jgi:hypothetical protein
MRLQRARKFRPGGGIGFVILARDNVTAIKTNNKLGNKMTNHTPEPTILDRLNHLADGLDNLRDNSKDDYDRGYIGAMIEEVELMISSAPRISFKDFAAVTAQRDELLNTLKQITHLRMPTNKPSKLVDLIERKALQAIAKCEFK